MSQYYIEFSLPQNSFHVDTLENIKAVNLDLCKRDINAGYVIIDGPYDDLIVACDECEKFNHLKKGKLDYATKD